MDTSLDVAKNWRWTILVYTELLEVECVHNMLQARRTKNISHTEGQVLQAELERSSVMKGRGEHE